MSAKFKPGRRRSFIHTPSAHWYNATRTPGDGEDSICVMGGSDGGGGVDYEFNIVWHKVSDGEVPRVEMFLGAWLAFAELADLFAWLSSVSGQTVTSDRVIEALIAMGFADETPRVKA